MAGGEEEGSGVQLGEVEASGVHQGEGGATVVDMEDTDGAIFIHTAIRLACNEICVLSSGAAQVQGRSDYCQRSAISQPKAIERECSVCSRGWPFWQLGCLASVWVVTGQTRLVESQ